MTDLHWCPKCGFYPLMCCCCFCECCWSKRIISRVMMPNSEELGEVLMTSYENFIRLICTVSVCATRSRRIDSFMTMMMRINYSYGCSNSIRLQGAHRDAIAGSVNHPHLEHQQKYRTNLAVTGDGGRVSSQTNTIVLPVVDESTHRCVGKLEWASIDLNGTEVCNVHNVAMSAPFVFVVG